MNMTIITMFVNAALEIYQRHLDQTGEKLTNEQVKAQLDAEIAGGQHQIAMWFAEKGLPIPE